MLFRKPRCRLLLVSIIALCVAGAWVSNQLLILHDSVGTTGIADRGLLAKLCRSVSLAAGGCESVSRNPWSHIPLPFAAPNDELPVAFIGMVYFISLGTWFALNGSPNRILPDTLLAKSSAGPSPLPKPWLAWAVTIGGGYASVFLIGLMIFGHVPLCIGCVAVHAINFLLIGGIWALYAPIAAPAAAPRNPGLPAPLAAIGTVVLLCMLLFLDRREQLALRAERNDLMTFRDQLQLLQSDPAMLVRIYLSEPKRAIMPRWGEINPTDRHELVVFTDYECPACYVNEQMLKDEIEPDFGGTLLVSRRHYPLCRNCNERVASTIHPNACKAAYAAEAARLLGGEKAFVRMNELLFANRARLGEEIYDGLAAQAGIDPVSFRQKMSGSAVQQVVAEDIALAADLDVRNTPTLYLDGRRVPLVCITPAFWKAVAKLPVQ